MESEEGWVEREGGGVSEERGVGRSGREKRGKMRKRKVWEVNKERESGAR